MFSERKEIVLSKKHPQQCLQAEAIARTSLPRGRRDALCEARSEAITPSWPTRLCCSLRGRGEVGPPAAGEAGGKEGILGLGQILVMFWISRDREFKAPDRRGTPPRVVTCKVLKCL